MVEVPIGNSTDHTEYVEGLAEFELEPSESTRQTQLGLTAHHDDDDVLDVSLYVHGLLENEQEALPLGQYTTATALIG